MSKLEQIAGQLDSQPRGRQFVTLCADLLSSMGFQDIYVRKGTESGRDIDARLGSDLWYFECKNTRSQIDSAKTAYKFLQLDSLASEQQPAYFVIITNGTTSSILKDIATSRNSDRSSQYVTYIWSNDEAMVFDDILLSYGDAFTQFLEKLPNKTRGIAAPLVQDFRLRSERHIREKQRFLPRFLATRSYADRRNGLETKVALVQAEKAFRDSCKALLVTGLDLYVVATPPLPTKPIYDFSAFGTDVDRLVDAMAHLDTMLIAREEKYLVFHEFMARTYLSDEGAIAINYMLLGGRSIDLPTWLYPLREHCVRIRNFAQMGILPVPFDIKAYIVDRADAVPPKLDGFDRHRRRDTLGESKRHARRGKWSPNPRVLFQSALIRVDAKPHSHYELARPLARSLWAKAGHGADLEQQARTFFEKWIQKTRTNEDKVQPDDIAFVTSFSWLFNDEVMDRSFSVFQNYLRDPDRALKRQPP